MGEGLKRARAAALATRQPKWRIDSKYHIEGNRIVKTSNGEAIPADEPTFLFRARDPLAVTVLSAYRQYCLETGATQYQIDLLDGMIGEFVRFSQTYPERMKVAGITEGK